MVRSVLLVLECECQRTLSRMSKIAPVNDEQAAQSTMAHPTALRGLRGAKHGMFVLSCMMRRQQSDQKKACCAKIGVHSFRRLSPAGRGQRQVEEKVLKNTSNVFDGV